MFDYCFFYCIVYLAVLPELPLSVLSPAASKHFRRYSLSLFPERCYRVDCSVCHKGLTLRIGRLLLTRRLRSEVEGNLLSTTKESDY